MRNEFDPDYRGGKWLEEALYEIDGDIVHFFTAEKVARLSGGFETLRIDTFEEGDLPKRLYFVVLRKPGELRDRPN